MTEEYADEIDDTLDDIERVVEDPSELYEHFRVVVDKGQSQVRIDKYLFERLGQLFAQPNPESSRCRFRHGKRQAGKKQL